MSPELIELLKEGGGWGLAVVSLTLLWRSNEARIAEIKDTSKVLNDNTNALDKLTTLISERIK